VSWRPDWEVDGADWPHREHSQFIDADGLRWHVQRAGRGPTLVLIHGTGSASHSWRGVFPLLSAHFDVIAFDLPGHGFTAPPQAERLGEQMSPHGMARAVGGLLTRLQVEPSVVVGNSAGAVVMMRLVLDQGFSPHLLIGLNAALLPFEGVPGAVFLPLAKLFASTPMTASWLSWQASDRYTVEALLRGTGSIPDADSIRFYQRLLRRSGHVAATLDMMANWELVDLADELRAFTTPLVLLVGMEDRAVPPAQAYRVQSLAPQIAVVECPGLGHLAQEEDPQRVAMEILRQAQGVGAAPHWDQKER